MINSLSCRQPVNKTQSMQKPAGKTLGFGDSNRNYNMLSLQQQPERLLRLKENHIVIPSPSSTFLSDKTKIGPGTVLMPGCVLMGENNIGPKNMLRDVFSEGGLTTEENVKISRSDVSHTALPKGSEIGPFTDIDGPVNSMV